MKEQLLRAYEAIPVPAGLAEQVLAACEAAPATPSVLPRRTARRWVTPAVSLAACAAVLFVTLAATGRLPGGSHHGAVVPPLSDGAEEEPDSTTTNTTTTTGRTENNAKPGEVQATTTANKSTTTKNFTTSKKMTMATTKKGIAPSQPLQTTRRTVATTSKQAHEIDPMLNYWGTFQAMSLEELEEYFGRRLRPSWIPEDLKETSIGEDGIYYWDETLENSPYLSSYLEQGLICRGDICRDHNAISYLDDKSGSYSRGFGIQVGKYTPPTLKIGPSDSVNSTGYLLDTTVIISGMEIPIYKCVTEWYVGPSYTHEVSTSYSTILQFGDTVLRANGSNLTREEFLKILESLL